MSAMHFPCQQGPNEENLLHPPKKSGENSFLFHLTDCANFRDHFFLELLS